MEPTWKHEATSQHFWTIDPDGNGITRIFSQFKLNWPLCFTLHHRNTFAHLVSIYEVAHFETYQIASTQLAIDRDIKERQTSQIVCQFETRSDGLGLFWSQRALLPDDATFVPSSLFGGDCWKLYSRHILPFIPPSKPKRRHRADDG